MGRGADPAALTRWRRAGTFVIAALAGISSVILAQAQARTSGLAGRWTLNRDASELPREIGFNPDWASGGAPGEGTTTSGRRRGPSSGGPGLFAPLENADEARVLQQLTAEVRNPSTHLTIVETPTTITITGDRGQPRTFQVDGKEEVVQVEGVPVSVTAKRDADQLGLVYRVERGRELRYTFRRTASPPQLIIDVEFTGRGGGDRVRRVYDPGSESETEVPPATAPAPPGRDATAAGAAQSGKPNAPPATDRAPAQTFNQKPGAELKGLTTLGIVVEGLGTQAAACGLDESTLEAALSKRLSAAGFTVRRNSDEDTYLYVNVMTSRPSTGLCVSRYDAFIYTNTTARLSYQNTPVLVQVSLLHRGGIAGGAPASHADAVLRDLQEYVDQFAARIRDANK